MDVIGFVAAAAGKGPLAGKKGLRLDALLGGSVTNSQVIGRRRRTFKKKISTHETEDELSCRMQELLTKRLKRTRHRMGLNSQLEPADIQNERVRGKETKDATITRPGDAAV